MEKSLPTVHWKKYLDINNGNPQVKKFLESRGDDVLWQIAQNIQRCNRRDKDILVMVIHENAPNAILIEKKDYLNVLGLCIKWFETKEHYERCSEIVTFQNNVKSKLHSKSIQKDSNKKLPKLI
jgi:hypothetical protein